MILGENVLLRFIRIFKEKDILNLQVIWEE